MIDGWDHTILANTLEKDAEKVECKISPGILLDLIVFWPAGCQYLAKCRIFLGEKSIAPRSERLSLKGEDTLLVLPDLYEPIKGNKPILNWEVWNLDDTYPHTLTLSARWLTEEEQYEKKAYLALDELAKMWRKALGK